MQTIVGTEHQKAPERLSSSNQQMGLAGESGGTNRTLVKTQQHSRQGSVAPQSNENGSDNLINLGDKKASRSSQSFRDTSLTSNQSGDTASLHEQPTTATIDNETHISLIKLRNQRQRQVRFKSLISPQTVISESDENQSESNAGQELIDLSRLQSSTTTHCDIPKQVAPNDNNHLNNSVNLKRNKQQRPIHLHSATNLPEDNNIYSEQDTGENFFNTDYDDIPNNEGNGQIDEHQLELNGYDGSVINDGDTISPSTHHRLKSNRLGQTQTPIGGILTKFKLITTDFAARISGNAASQVPYYNYDSDQDLQQESTIPRRYKFSGPSSNSCDVTASATTASASTSHTKRHNHLFSERSFRGPYRYSRLGIVMALLKRLFSFLFQRSTLALFGAFLIHITLGTVYTLSNVNSYLTSYMRLHGTPNATYGGSMWISSTYAVGQGLSMVLGGYLEKRFSARLACILGCSLHSLSIMSTSVSVNHGQLAVLLSYGLLPGFGCGLAYMTPMSNGFGWFPHRKGLVAGVILAGFGIGTFVFNMAQTAYVNPGNLSPPNDSGGYFTQESILKNVPHLFVFLGTIYASMQFVGCCLLFKPPSPDPISSAKADMHDERPLLMSPDEIGTNCNNNASPTNSSCSTTRASSPTNMTPNRNCSLAQLPFKKAIKTREFFVLFVVFGVTNQGVLFVNSMLKEYAQIFIDDDMYLAWTGSMASIANSLGRLVWGLAIDRYSFTQCFTAITTIFGTLMFLMPFEFILSSKLLYLICTLGVFGSFSGWMSTYPVHLSRVFGVKNSGMVYGLIFVSQSIGGIMTAFGAHYLIDHYTRFVPFFVVTFLEVFGLAVYHLFYFK